MARTTSKPSSSVPKSVPTKTKANKSIQGKPSGSQQVDFTPFKSAKKQNAARKNATPLRK